MENYIKNHIKSLKPAATLAINEKCKKLREEGKQVFNFGFGGSPFSIPDKIVSALKNNLELSVPVTEGNSDYAEIMRQVDAGELTIEEAE